MTKLREQMIHEMVLRGLAPNTQRAYLQAVSQLARHYGRSPDRISKREIKAYLLYLHQDAHRSTSTCNVAAAAMRFLYHQTLGRSHTGFEIPFARRPKKLPQVLSRQEVARLLSRTRFLRHRVLFAIAYSAGLRVSEIVKLRPGDIDSDRMVIRVEQGKGYKDRLAALSPRLLQELRTYWRREQPGEFLFPSPVRTGPLCAAALKHAFGRAKQRAKIDKPGGIHLLRHHADSWIMPRPQRWMPVRRGLASGKSVRWVASQLGHSNPELTLRVYVHALREEETDLSFLDFGGARRHARGTQLPASTHKRKPLRATPRRGSRMLEHETGLEPATPTLAISPGDSPAVSGSVFPRLILAA